MSEKIDVFAKENWACTVNCPPSVASCFTTAEFRNQFIEALSEVARDIEYNIELTGTHYPAQFDESDPAIKSRKSKTIFIHPFATPKGTEIKDFSTLEKKIKVAGISYDLSGMQRDRLNASGQIALGDFSARKIMRRPLVGGFHVRR